MNGKMWRSRFAILSASIFFVLSGISAYASTSPELVKQEAGYYYGYGKGSTEEAALIEAKRDLVSNALTATLRASNAAAPSISVNPNAIKNRLPDLKPYKKAKAGQAPAVTCRIKIADWDKEEKVYADALRTELSSRIAALSGKKNTADRISESAAILARLSDEGETDLLTAQPGSTELLSHKVESVCAAAVKSIKFAFAVKDGFIDSASKLSVKAADASGNAVSGLALNVSWTVPDLPADDAAAVSEVRAVVKTDSLGNTAVDYPSSAEYHNRMVTLTVTTACAASAPSSAVLKKLDESTAADARYIHFDDIKTAYPSVVVPAGKFNAGAVAQDTRAGKKEAAHTVETGSYAIDIGPVTNARYAAFIHATRAENIPEYFDNPDYNQGNQPVVGISEKDAEAYAAWLSAQTGNTYRLPTEAEWEKAARAGQETIYPWGDDSPAEAKKANYSGNGTFSAPSPVGSFENGKNAWGLVDMSGNVWEWTSSTHSKDPASALCTVKGGSWMDGPTDLRISNSRDLDGQKGYPDVGFRLIMEVSK